VLPGAFGPDMSLQYGNVMTVLDLYGFCGEEKLTALWMLNVWLSAYRGLELKETRR